MTEVRVIPQRTFHRNRISLVAEESKEGIKKGGGNSDNNSLYLGRNGETTEGGHQGDKVWSGISTQKALR
jgi:hypothetical protein